MLQFQLHFYVLDWVLLHLWEYICCFLSSQLHKAQCDRSLPYEEGLLCKRRPYNSCPLSALASKWLLSVFCHPSTTHSKMKSWTCMTQPFFWSKYPIYPSLHWDCQTLPDRLICQDFPKWSHFYVACQTQKSSRFYYWKALVLRA